MIYDQLPVFKTAYDMLLQVFNCCRNMQRDYRYTLAEKLKNETIELLICIYNANKSQDKLAYIEKAQEHLVVVKIQIRLLNDLKQISLRRYAAYAESVASISKQLTAWHAYIEKKYEKTKTV
ncbi:MAG: four helix bundle protein [Massilibacteroides sp.]|nr:four helix bundle protein [Massilibacteroides sp.]MDD3062312.1 four helix bundle protein [Massilibacteroides sp.]MDD4660667.1 four helix bundle protein [Massilibacteroides sp.]